MVFICGQTFRRSNSYLRSKLRNIHQIVCVIPQLVYVFTGKVWSCKPIFVIIKPTRCSNLSNLFWNETLHVTDSSSVHHQEFSTVHTAMVYISFKFADSLRAGSGWKCVLSWSCLQACKTYLGLDIFVPDCKQIWIFSSDFYTGSQYEKGHAVAQLVEALRYKPEGRGFDSRWCHWKFSLTSFRPHYGPGVDSAS